MRLRLHKRYNSNNILKKWALPVILVLVVISIGIGYSAFISNMNIGGTVAKVRKQSDIRVTGLSVYNTNQASTTYAEYNVKSISSGILLSEANSSITFAVEVTNIGNEEAGIYSITGLPSNLKYELTDSNGNNYEKTKICIETGNCTLGISKELYLKISYLDGSTETNFNTIYNLNLDIDFEPFYNITYTNISGSYQSEIINKDTLRVNFGGNAPQAIEIMQGNTKRNDYTYTNGVLTLPNVTGDLEITGLSTTVNNYLIYGNSVQNEIPMPESPSEIYSVGDKTKNLFVDDATLYTKPVNYYILPITLEQGSTYIISSELVGEEINGTVVVGITKNGTQYSEFQGFMYTLHTGTKDKYFTRIFTVDSSWTDPKLVVYAKSTAQIQEIFEKYHIQLEKSSTKTDYEPYGKYKIPIIVNGNETTNIYLDEPLRKVGNYADYIDFANQKVVRNVDAGNLNDIKNWAAQTTGGTYAAWSLTKTSLGSSSTVLPSTSTNMICTHYEVKSFSVINKITVGNSYINFITRNTYQTLQEWQQYLMQQYDSGTPVSIVYPSATPTEESITLPTITNSNGIRSISVGTSIQPSNVEFDY